MRFANCPYDGDDLRITSEDHQRSHLACPTCDAAWTWDRGWIARVHAPDEPVVLTGPAGSGRGRRSRWRRAARDVTAGER